MLLLLLWHLVGRQEGHPTCNKLGIDLLVVTNWLELQLSPPPPSSLAPINFWILIPANQGRSGKWLLKWKTRKTETQRQWEGGTERQTERHREKETERWARGCTAEQVITSSTTVKKLVPWGTDGRLPSSDLDLDLGYGHTAIPSCITHRPLPTYQISLRSEEIFFLKVTTEVLVKFRVTWHKN